MAAEKESPWKEHMEGILPAWVDEGCVRGSEEERQELPEEPTAPRVEDLSGQRPGKEASQHRSTLGRGWVSFLVQD